MFRTFRRGRRWSCGCIRFTFRFRYLNDDNMESIAGGRSRQVERRRARRFLWAGDPGRRLNCGGRERRCRGRARESVIRKRCFQVYQRQFLRLARQGAH